MDVKSDALERARRAATSLRRRRLHRFLNNRLAVFGLIVIALFLLLRKRITGAMSSGEALVG